MQVNCSHDFLLSLTSLQKVQLALIFFGFILLENQPTYTENQSIKICTYYNCATSSLGINVRQSLPHDKNAQRTEADCSLRYPKTLPVCEGEPMSAILA